VTLSILKKRTEISEASVASICPAGGGKSL